MGFQLHPQENEAEGDDLVTVDRRVIQRFLISIASLDLNQRQSRYWTQTADQIGMGMNEHGEIIIMKDGTTT